MTSDEDTSTDVQAIIAERDMLREKLEERTKVLRKIAVFDRDFLIAHGSMSQRERYHKLARRIKADIFRQRRILGERFVQEHAEHIDPTVADFDLKAHGGYQQLDLSHHPLVKDVVRESLDAFEKSGGANAERLSKGSLQYIGSSNKLFGSDSAIYKLAVSPEILVPVTRYFGLLPILTGYGLTYAPNEEYLRKSSQRLHFDPEDRTQIKVFVYITDVDADSGPFMAAPAPHSAHLFNQHDFILDRQDDSVVAEGKIHPALGPAGTVIFCDTCQCLHAGARQASKSRIMLSIEYNLPSYLWAPLCDGDGELRDRMKAITEMPEDEIMAAVLGRSLVTPPPG